MGTYKVIVNHSIGFEVLTEEEFIEYLGEYPYRNYAGMVYREEMTLDEVPEEHRTIVEGLVAKRVERWGKHEDHRVTPTELQKMAEEVL